MLDSFDSIVRLLEWARGLLIEFIQGLRNTVEWWYDHGDEIVEHFPTTTAAAEEEAE